MSARKACNATAARKSCRCAVYTRKSTEEGLGQDFNSLDAQREAAEAYIKSQAHEGWVRLPEHYDDGGFTGGNMDRPALARLLANIEAGRIDAVIVYKVDRFSRSLLDFAKMMELFERHQVAFVSVTQQFHTGTSMGRLILNVLLSFAQFEREIIAERTRDKIGAARKKGKWSGGMPRLGYDVDPQLKKLVVNEKEAALVRAIFQLYLEHQALRPVVQELERRGWVNKRWVSRRGGPRGGRPFTKPRLYELLTNVLYAGKVKHKNEVHEGEHPAIVDMAVWEQVQAHLREHGRGGAAVARNHSGALLKGLLHCVPCGSAMTPAHATKNGSKRYRYYTCSSAQRRGWHTCPSPSLPVAEIERFILEQLHRIAHHKVEATKPLTALSPEEQACVVEALVERVDYDGTKHKVTIHLHPSGMEELRDRFVTIPEDANP